MSKSPYIREDTHKKVFFSGRTTKGVGRLTPPPTSPDHYAKKHFFSINPAFLAQKFERKKNCQNPFQAIIRLKKRGEKVAWTNKPLV